MSTKEQIKLAAMSLGPGERQALVEELLLSIDDTDRAEVEAAWLTEARRRDEVFVKGTMGAKPVDEVRPRMADPSSPDAAHLLVAVIGVHVGLEADTLGHRVGKRGTAGHGSRVR